MLYNAPSVLKGGDAGSRLGGDRPLSVGIILLPRFSFLSLAALVETLRHASTEQGRDRQISNTWTTMASTMDLVQSSCGIGVTPWERLGDPGRFDYVVVVGGAIERNQPVQESLVEYLRRCSAEGLRIVGVAGGVVPMVHAGLLRQRRCCVHWASFGDMVGEFDDIHPVGDQLFVTDGNRITCAGEASAADLAYWMIERHCGPAAAQHSFNQTLIGSARPGNSAQPHPAVESDVEHDRVRRAVIIMQQNLSEPMRLEEIASRVHVSKRQLERLFQRELGHTVQAFSRRLRLRYGLFKLMNTAMTVTAIAQECGFSDSSHFCRKFGQFYGRSPSEMRARPDLATLAYAGPDEAERMAARRHLAPVGQVRISAATA